LRRLAGRLGWRTLAQALAQRIRVLLPSLSLLTDAFHQSLYLLQPLLLGRWQFTHGSRHRPLAQLDCCFQPPEQLGRCHVVRPERRLQGILKLRIDLAERRVLDGLTTLQKYHEFIQPFLGQRQRQVSSSLGVGGQSQADPFKGQLEFMEWFARQTAGDSLPNTEYQAEQEKHSSTDCRQSEHAR
jgi:hypothetical protein